MYSFILVYISMVYYSILSILRMEKFASMSKIFYAIITVFGALIIIINIFYKKNFEKKIIFITCALIIIPMYYSTSIFYRYTNELYKYRFFYIIVFCLLPLIIGYFDSLQDKIKKMIKFTPIFSIVFAIGSFIATFFSSGSTQWGGYVEDASGFNYQLCSYCAAYSFGLIIFYFINFDQINKMKIFSKKSFKFICLIIIILNWITILISGGKGGFVTAIIYSLYSVYMIRGKIKLKISTILKIIIITLALIFISNLIISYARKSTLSVSGFSRIIDFVKSGDDTGRSNQYILAINSIKEKPYIGHGIGSVYYEVPPYTHNFFLDILVETGLVGLIIWILVLINVFRKMHNMVKENNKYNLLIIIFISGFIMSMFSGYYLSHSAIMWGIGYCIGMKKVRNIKQIVLD